MLRNIVAQVAHMTWQTCNPILLTVLKPFSVESDLYNEFQKRRARQHKKKGTEAAGPLHISTFAPRHFVRCTAQMV